jgi:hypothetical protein
MAQGYPQSIPPNTWLAGIYRVLPGAGKKSKAAGKVLPPDPIQDNGKA